MMSTRMVPMMVVALVVVVVVRQVVVELYGRWTELEQREVQVHEEVRREEQEQ
jgi:hypothetical protein